MAEATIIAWTNRTWNPWKGCTRISPGCAHCYMFTAQERYGQDPSQVIRTKTWGDPLKWQREAEANAKASGTAFFFKQSAAPKTEMGDRAGRRGRAGIPGHLLGPERRTAG